VDAERLHGVSNDCLTETQCIGAAMPRCCRVFDKYNLSNNRTKKGQSLPA